MYVYKNGERKEPWAESLILLQHITLFAVDHVQSSLQKLIFFTFLIIMLIAIMLDFCLAELGSVFKVSSPSLLLSSFPYHIRNRSLRSSHHVYNDPFSLLLDLNLCPSGSVGVKASCRNTDTCGPTQENQ